MRSHFWIAAIASMLFFQLGALAVGQESSQKMIHATLVRVRLNAPVEAPAKFGSAGDLQKMLSKLGVQEKIGAVETLRMQALSGVPATTQVGRTVPVVTGVASSRGGVTTRSVRNQEFGTLVKLQTRLEGNRVFANIQYDASYPEIADNKGDEERPEYERRTLTTLSCRSTVVAEYGEVTLIQHQQNGDAGVLLYVEFRDGDSSQRSRSSRRVSSSQGGTTGLASAPAELSERAKATRASFARAFVSRYDRNQDQKLSLSEMMSSSALRTLRGRSFSKLREGESVAVSDVVEALLSSGYFERRPTSGAARTGGPATPSSSSRRGPAAPSSSSRPGPAADGASGRRSTGINPADARYRRYAESIVKRYDKNEDGKLSRDEFSNSSLSRFIPDGRESVTVDEFEALLKRSRSSSQSSDQSKPDSEDPAEK